MYSSRPFVLPLGLTNNAINSLARIVDSVCQSAFSDAEQQERRDQIDAWLAQNLGDETGLVAYFGNADRNQEGELRMRNIRLPDPRKKVVCHFQPPGVVDGGGAGGTGSI